MSTDSGRARPRGRPRRSESDRALHRQRLVEAAMEAIRRHGGETSVDQMAETAGVSKPVFYAEFSDKFGIVDAMALVLAQKVESTVVAGFEQTGNAEFEATIAAVVNALIDLMVDEPQLYAYIMRNFRMRDRGLLDNALSRVIRDRSQLILGDLADEIGPVDLDILAAGVFGFVFGVLESWMVSHQPDKAELMEIIAGSIRGGVLAVAGMRRRQPASD